MTDPAQIRIDAPAKRSRLLRVGAAAASVVGLLAVGFLVEKWVSPVDVSSGEDVATEWNHTVAQLMH